MKIDLRKTQSIRPETLAILDHVRKLTGDESRVVEGAIKLLLRERVLIQKELHRLGYEDSPRCEEVSR